MEFLCVAGFDTNYDFSFLFFKFQWIFWVGPFIGAALAALYHQIVIRAIPFKSSRAWTPKKSSFLSESIIF